MSINSYSVNSNTHWPAALNMRFLFKEGMAHIQFACSSNPVNEIARQRLTNQEAQQDLPLSLGQRFTRLAVGTLLCLPIINTITYLALPYLQGKQGQMESPQQPGNSAGIASSLPLPTAAAQPLSSLPVPEENPISSLPNETLFEIFSHFGSEELGTAKSVCQSWQTIANDPMLVTPLKKQIQAEVQKARQYLEQCTRCSEGDGGYRMWLRVDGQGHIHALSAHDVDMVWLNAETQQKCLAQCTCEEDLTFPEDIYSLAFLVRASDWDPNTNPAFRICEYLQQNDLPAEIKNIQQLILEEFNHLAKGAQQIAKDKQIKASCKTQAWFDVIINPAYSRSDLVLASTTPLPSQNSDVRDQVTPAR